jgi:hypothetical protein
METLLIFLFIIELKIEPMTFNILSKRLTIRPNLALKQDTA